uniref:PARP catalytic domain-containing protein n=1 Tax=Aureoumbra lagunensis TaxID=44058 RepID=A0A7S3NNL0_9STRA
MKFVATNMNMTGHSLEPNILPWSIVPSRLVIKEEHADEEHTDEEHTDEEHADDQVRYVAILSAIDTIKVEATSPNFLKRVEPLEQSIVRALFDLAQLPTGEEPKAVVLILPHYLSESDFQVLLPDGNPLDEDDQKSAAIILAQRHPTIDLIIRTGSTETEIELYDDWSGHPFALAQITNGARGKLVTQIHLELDDTDFGVREATATNILLDCQIDQDNNILSTINEYKTQAQNVLESTIVGDVTSITNQGCDGEGLCYGPRFASLALRETYDAFVTFVNSDDFVQDLQGRVTMADLYRALPNLDEVAAIRIFFDSTVETRLSALNIINSLLTDVASIPYSDSVSYKWAFVDGIPSITDLSIYGLTIDELRLVIEAQNGNLFNDGFLLISDRDRLESSFPDERIDMLMGVTQFEIVAHYLQTLGSFDPVLVFNKTLAVSRDPDITIAHVALLCGTGPRRTEECDHARAAAAMLNDGFDGFFDDLSLTRIVTYTAYVGKEDTSIFGYRTCGVENKAIDGLIDIINNRLPEGDSLTGVITSCSSDVAQISSIEARATVAAATGRDANYIIVSPSSTATELNDDNAYPSVARLVTSENLIGSATARLAEDYGWDRVAMIYEDSIWGSSAAQGFVDRHLSNEFGGTILGDGNCIADSCAHYALHPETNQPVGLSVPAGYVTTDTVNELLDFVQTNGASIIFLIFFDEEQRLFFTAANDRGFVETPGYGWITNLPTDSALIDSTGEPILDAINGQLGSLGFVEDFPDYGEADLYTSYLDIRSSSVSIEACSIEGRTNAAPDDDNPISPNVFGTFDVCDTDNDPTTSSTYGQVWFDAVLVLAYGIARSSNTIHDMYNSIISQSVEGISGTIILSSSTGDRLNRLNLANLQVVETFNSRRRLRAVSLPASKATFIDVAEYDASNDNLNFLADATVNFPGDTTEIPVDSTQEENNDESNNKTKSNSSIIIIIVVIAACVLCCLGTIFLYIVRRQQNQFREEALQFAAEYDVTRPFLRRRKRIIIEKSRADIGAPPKFPLYNRNVIETPQIPMATDEMESEMDLDYEESMHDGHGTNHLENNNNTSDDAAIELIDHTTKDDAKQEDAGIHANARTVFRDMWCWQEDDDQLYRHRDANLIDGNWVQYSDVDQERLCDLWTLVQRDEATSPVLRVDASDASAAYAINVDRMTQTRIGIKDAGTRQVRRIPGRRRVYLTFYWLEDPEPQKWKNASDGKVYQPDKDVPWTQYTDDGVQNHLARLFASFQADPRASLIRDKNFSTARSVVDHTNDWILRLNQWNQITTNYAEVQYEIDIRTFEQTRLDTGKVRCIAVRMEHPDSPDRDRHDAIDDEEYRPPPGLPQKDRLLPLSPGMQISLIKAPRTLAENYGDWGYGAELDPQTGDVLAEGWFPMICVEKKTQIAAMPQGIANLLVTQTQPPSEWTGAETIFSNNTNVRLIPGTREWRDLSALFDIERYSISSILRIQHFDRWSVYRTYGIGKKEIRPVFHGTTREAAEKILATGLNRDYAKNSVYGRGVNFFLDSSKSCHRDYGNLGIDSKYVFVCSIFVNSMTRGDEDAIIPQGYDTFVDSISKPTLYVTTHDAQCYTHYLVKLAAASRNNLTPSP